MYIGSTPTLSTNRTTIKHLEHICKNIRTKSSHPLKERLEEGKLYIWNDLFMSFKSSSIPLTPKTPHETMRDHILNHTIVASTKPARSSITPLSITQETPNKTNTYST